MTGMQARTNDPRCNPLALREAEQPSGSDDENSYHQDEGEGQPPGGIQDECDVLLHYRDDIRSYYGSWDAADSAEHDDDERYGQGSPSHRRGEEDYVRQEEASDGSKRRAEAERNQVYRLCVYAAQPCRIQVLRHRPHPYPYPRPFQEDLKHHEDRDSHDELDQLRVCEDQSREADVSLGYLTCELNS